MSIMKMTSTSNRNSQYFQKLHDYITEDTKTEGVVGANGCSVVNAVPSMETLKKLLHKTGGRQTIEITLSLTPDMKGTDDNIYLRVADRVASFYPDYQSYYAVHKDSNLRHIHIVMNSVNFKTGRKFTQSKSELNRFRQQVNTVLKKFGFDIITESANNIWDDSEHSGTTFSYLELYEFMPDSRRFDLDIQPVADPLQMEDIFQEDSRNNITEKAVPWHYDGNGRECRNPDYPSDICDFSTFGFGRNYERNSPMFNPNLLANFHNPFEEAFKLPMSQRWNFQQPSVSYLNSPYNRRREPTMYRNQPSMSAPAYFTPPASAFGGQTSHYPYRQGSPYGSQSGWEIPNMYGNQAFSPVPPYPNQPTPDFQNNPYSTYSSCPPNSSPYCQGSFQGSQPGWGTQDMHGNLPFMPAPTSPNQPMSGFQNNPYSTYSSCPPNNSPYYQGSFQGTPPEWGTQDMHGNPPFMPAPTSPNCSESVPLWQLPYPPDTPYGTPYGNPQYQENTYPQQIPSPMPQNPYPMIGIHTGTVYSIHTAPGTDIGYLAHLAENLEQLQQQQPILAANIGWTMGKTAFRQGIPANFYVDASPRIEFNLTEPPVSDTDTNNEGIIDTTLTDTDNTD